MYYSRERHTQPILIRLNYQLHIPINPLKRIRKQEERLESNQYYSPGTRIKFRGLRLTNRALSSLIYNMTSTEKSLPVVFRTFIDLLRCDRLARRACSLLHSLLLCLCRQCQSSTWFILSAFTAFATSGDALIGLSLLSILERRSWIVSLAPFYMPFFCVSTIQRAFLLCGRKRSRTAGTIRGSGVRKKLATQKIRTPLHTIPGAHRTFRPC